MGTTTTPEWSVAELDERLERGEDFYVLDVRNRDEFAASRIEGRRPLETTNVPYFEMLEAGGADDLVDSVVAYVEAELARDLPKEGRILAVCAKGDTSEYVVRGLRRLGYDAANLAGGTAAWGDFYRVKVVTESPSLTLLQLIRPARGCLSYVIVSDGRGAVVDPLRHAERYLSLAEELGFSIDVVVDTHGHADHISSGPVLARELAIPYHLHPYDGIHPIDALPAALEYEYLRDGSAFVVGTAALEAIHVPGHTLGNLVFRVNDEYLLSGDSIFVHSVSRPDLGGHGEAWAPLHHASLVRLLELPDSTRVLPGHFSTRAESDESGVFAGVLGQLRRENEGLLMAQRGERAFVDYVLASLPDFPDEYVEIKRVNAGLSRPDEERASELEIGQNLCALARGLALDG